MNEAETAAGLPETSHYRYAQRVGDQLFVAGQVPQAADGSIVAPGESLYRALSAEGNPSFATVLKVARALGVKLHAAAA
jgi:enamine deaminase RidA (YjgF/YER057c/UK114 family)